MYLLEVLLMLFFSLYVHTSNIQIPKLWEHNTRRLNGPHDDHDNCFCYPGGPLPTIHNILDSQNNGLERLVIYLYKNVGSNEIKMYTPNTEKQVLIPDIPYEAGDELVTITTESVTTLFYNNPHRIKVFNNRFETINPSVIDSLPIGLNLGAVEIIYPNDASSLTPNEGYKRNYYNIDIPPNGHIVPQTQPINNLPGIAITNTWPSPGENDGENPQTIEQFWWSNKINYPHALGPSGNVNPSIDRPNDSVFAFHTNGGATSLASSSFTQNLNEPFSNQYVTFTIWFNTQMKRFQNIQMPNDVKELEHNSLRILVQQTLAENNIHVSDDGVLIDSNGVVIDAANLELRPLLLGEKIGQQIWQNSLNQIILPKNLPYLEGILVTLVNPPQVLGIIPLGKTYLSQFFSLGNSVNSSRTYLKDYGNANSASYSSVSNGPLKITIKDTYSAINAGSPYLYSGDNEGLISSNIYSKEPSSPPYSYSSTNTVPYSDTSKISYWSSGPYAISQEPTKWTPSPNAQVIGKRRKLTDAKIEHHYEPISRTTKKKGKGRLYGKSKKPIDKKLDELKENTTPEPSTYHHNTSESGRKFEVPSVKSVMKTLLYLLDDAPSRGGFELGTNSTETTDDIVIGSENLHDADQPGFRIIGGNAATGSGTPLSNKGRSGYSENM